MTSEVMDRLPARGDACVMTTTRPASAGKPSTRSTHPTYRAPASGKPPAGKERAGTTTEQPDRHVARQGTRGFLLADAALTGVNGLAYVVLPGVLGDAFGMSSGLLVGLGVFLLVIATEIGFLATRGRIPRWGVRLLAEVNVAWVVASLVFAAVADLSTLGVIWVIVQAVAVAGFAARQWMISK